MIYVPSLDDTLLVIDMSNIRVIYRKLMMLGFTQIEATNFLALAMGLELSVNGWKLKELQELMFLRWLKQHNNEDIIGSPRISA